MMAQLPLIPDAAILPRFDGESFEASSDARRLQSQLKAVEGHLLDAQWHTIPQIALALRKRAICCTEASISARIFLSTAYRLLRRSRETAYLLGWLPAALVSPLAESTPRLVFAGMF
jgi:hypothetical protein